MEKYGEVRSTWKYMLWGMKRCKFRLSLSLSLAYPEILKQAHLFETIRRFVFNCLSLTLMSMARVLETEFSNVWMRLTSLLLTFAYVHAFWQDWSLRILQRADGCLRAVSYRNHIFSQRWGQQQRNLTTQMFKRSLIARDSMWYQEFHGKISVEQTLQIIYVRHGALAKVRQDFTWTVRMLAIACAAWCCLVGLRFIRKWNSCG